MAFWGAIASAAGQYLGQKPPTGIRLGEFTQGRLGESWGGDVGQGVPPEVAAQMQAQAMGASPSAILLRAALAAQQRQRMAAMSQAGGSNMNTMLMSRAAQLGSSQAGMQAQAQTGAQRGEELQSARQAFIGMQLKQQQFQDQMRNERERQLMEAMSKTPAGQKKNEIYSALHPWEWVTNGKKTAKNVWKNA